LQLIFDRTQKLSVEDIYLPDLGATMTNVQIQLMPTNRVDYNQNEVELFFDEGQIMIEMHDLSVAGHGLIRDPETGFIEIL